MVSERLGVNDFPGHIDDESKGSLGLHGDEEQAVGIDQLRAREISLRKPSVDQLQDERQSAGTCRPDVASNATDPHAGTLVNVWPLLAGRLDIAFQPSVPMVGLVAAGVQDGDKVVLVNGVAVGKVKLGHERNGPRLPLLA